jgi:hypothetical protein
MDRAARLTLASLAGVTLAAYAGLQVLGGSLAHPLRVSSIRGRHVSDMESEKQTVGDRGRSAATAANTAAKPLDNTYPEWTAVECRPSARTAVDGSGRCAYSYGVEGLRGAVSPDVLA